MPGLPVRAHVRRLDTQVQRLDDRVGQHGERLARIDGMTGNGHGAAIPPAASASPLRRLWRRVPDPVRAHLRYGYARAHDLTGRDYFPARGGLDRRLLAWTGARRGGTFIEAGAYDGIDQSNSWHFERRLGWRGLLVEPIPESAALCRRFRRSTVECCALGSPAQAGTTLAMRYGGLMTTADGAAPRRMRGGSAERHAAEGAARTGRAPYAFTAPVTTLSTLIDAHRLGPIDVLSLDVEGLEADALAGLDVSRHRVDHILVETVDPLGTAALLGPGYAMVERMARHDYLFRRTDLGPAADPAAGQTPWRESRDA